MSNKTEKRSLKPLIILIIGIVGASLSSTFIKFSDAPSVVTAAYRLLWTVLLMTPAMFLRREVRKELLHVRPKTLMLSAVSGVFLAVHFSAWFESLQHTSVASATVIVCTEVIWVALGYCIFLWGRLGIKPIVAIIITLVGSVMIALTDFSVGSSGLYGDLLALAAAVAAGIYTLLGRVVRGSTSTAVYTYIVYISCTAVLVSLSFAGGHSLTGYGYKGIVSGFLLAVFSTILGHSIFSWSLKYFSPSFVAAGKLCEPVISSILAFFLFSEIPTPLQLAGCAVVIAGVLFYTLIETKSRRSL